MKKNLSALFLVIVLIIFGFVEAASAENKAPPKKPVIEVVVYLVLLSQSPPVHMIEMSSMSKCEAAARHTSGAKCIFTKAVGVDALKAKVGGVGHLLRLPVAMRRRK